MQMKRVIANRTVQMTRQLQEMGIEADEDQLLQDFAEDYGALCLPRVVR
ncbi:MAG: hypothetical protein M1270_00350 [Gammaproteobacteria bacterium]|nr:hypothetical protein [Gammaproteobacteria bacterium]